MKYFFCFFIFPVIQMLGQVTYSIQGNVTDEKGNPVAIGDVLIFDEEKQTLLHYVSLREGSFQFDALPPATYQLKISALGFLDHEEAVLLDKNKSLSIQLKEKATQLENVEVVASKNPITTANGNITIDVTNPIFSSLADPLDLLSRLPNVQISPDRESISVISRGTPLIYLGKQRISLEEFLGLSVDAIQSIALIANPSPKYEAEGRAVLLVNLKKDFQKGTTLNLSETFSSKRNLNNFLSGNGTYSNGKWNLRGNLNYNRLGQWESNSFAFNIPSQDIFTDYVVLVPANKRRQVNAGLGFYFPISEDDYFSLNTTLRHQTDDAPIETETLLRNGDQEDFILTNTVNDNSKVYQSANFNFNKKLTKKLNLFTGVQYSQFTQKLNSNIANNVNDSGFQLDQIRDQEYQINSLAMRIDVEQKISEQARMEFGASWSDTQADAYTQISEPLLDAESITNYDYKESLYGLYVNWNSKLGKKINYNLGARTEENRVKGILDNESEPLVERDNFRVFPKVGLNYQVDSVKTLSINYAKSITRPNFSRTSTITLFINPFLEGTNNINILPTLTNELNMNLQVKQISYFFGLYRNTNPVSYAISYEEGDSAAALSPINLDREKGMYLGMTLPVTHNKWTATNTVSINYNKMEDDAAEILIAKPYLYAYTNHQFRIKKDTVVSFGGWFLTERQEGIYKRNSMLVIEAALTQKIGALDFALRFNDITRAMVFEERYSINGVEAEGAYIGDGREVALSIKYNFSKGKASKFKNKDVDENLNRIN